MRPNTPPGIATWMLEHLTLGKKNEALAGDLLEEFRRGRSAGWYWRQVLAAILLGFASELRTQWPAIVYTTLCAIPVPTFLILTVENVLETPFFASRWHLAWPYSTIFDVSLWYGAQLIYIWLALMIYFLLFSLATRTINLHRFAGGLGKSALVFVAVSIGTLALFVILPEHAGRAIYRTRVTAMQLMSESLFLWMRLPFFFTLFLSIWMTLSRIDERPTSVVSPT